LKEVKLNDVFHFVKSYSISRDGLIDNENSHQTYCVHYGDIHAFYEGEFLDFEIQKKIPQLISEIKIDNEDYLQDGDIIMADASEDYLGVGETVIVCNLGKKKAIGGLHTIVLRGNSEIIFSKYAAYLFASEGVKNKLRKMANGTSVYSVSKSTLNNLSLIIHNSLKEQTAIAQVLQAADKEIEILKQKTEKLKAQKKGLMQQLLTGKIRVKI
jgi:type I restriction enzyme S subunit